MLTVTNMIGIAAGVFVILAFYATDDRVLRQHAIASNLLFMIYALLVWLWPIFLLHAILLPLNLVRLAQIDTRDAHWSRLQMSAEERARFEAGLARDPYLWAVYGRAGSR